MPYHEAPIYMYLSFAGLRTKIKSTVEASENNIVSKG